MISQKLFSRFLKNECNEEERLQIAEYFSEHPEELDRFLPPEEFTELTEIPSLGSELEKRMYRRVRRNAFVLPVRRRIVTRAVAAAAVMALAFAGWWLFTMNSGQEGSRQLAGNELENRPYREDVWEQLNASDKTMQLMLPDSSAVELGPHSSLKYYGVFGRDRQRNIYLSGEARFYVVGKSNSPFTVYSGAIATTALGTSFTVSAFEDRNIISVYLHTGKVVIKASDPLVHKLENDMYLDPGEKLFYNKTTWQASIYKPQADKAGIAATKNSSSENVVYKPDWYMFNGQQLAGVLDQLSFYYGVDINYKKEDIKDNYLTAKFSAVDSLDKILKDIALLNRLLVTEKNGRYFIRKQTH